MKIQMYKLILVIFAFSWIHNANSADGTLYHTSYSEDSAVLATEDGTLVADATTGGDWDLRYYRNQIVLIGLDGILVPIEIEKRALTADNDTGSFIFHDGELISATSTPVGSFELPAEYTFKYRPTLFVSISGFQTSLEGLTIDPLGQYGPIGFSIDGKQWAGWQDVFNGKLQEEFIDNQNYQYKHMFVRWDNQKSARKQGAALANKIKRFLDNRRYKWDVVLVGHSRGGIMVNRISKYLVGHSKIDNLHSYLLDPTAPELFGDQYPTSLPSKSPTKSFGTLYYDGNMFASATYNDDVIFSTDVGVNWSDMDILGYKTVVMNDSIHETIHLDWIKAPQNGLAQAFVTIQSKKTVGLYVPDGTLGMDIIQVSATHGVDLWGETGCDSSSCWARGDVTLDGFTVGYGEVEVDRGGVELSYGIPSVISGQYVIRKDQLLIAQTFGVPFVPILQAGVKAELNKRGLTGNASFIGVKVGAGINTSDLLVIDVNVFGIVDIDGNVNDAVVDPIYNGPIKFVGDGIVYTGNAAVDIGTGVLDAGDQVITDVGDVVGDGLRAGGRLLDVTSWSW